MKVTKIFMALAAMAMVGCSSEDVMDFSANQAPEDSNLIQLDPNFVLAGVGADDNVTRTHWELDDETKALVNKFLPIYKAGSAIGNLLSVDADLDKQAVGLCWLGQGAVGTDVYTNYQFYHFGWLNNDETEADIDCDQLLNGSLYSDVTMKVAGTEGNEAAPASDFTLKTKSMKAGKDNLNYNSGVYQTKNKAIFGGEYIVYYPFNPDFKDRGTIPAIAQTLFSPASTEFTTKELGNATFRYSAPVTIEGGSQAAGFGLKNLSALVQLRVATPKGDAAAGVDKIDRIVLYSPSKKLLKQANLAADKIVANQKGEALYASTEGTKTITAQFSTAVTLQETTSKTPAPTSAYITVLPTTVEDLVVMVHSTTQEGWATVELGNTVFEAGSAKRLDITVKQTDFDASYTAVDDASLRTALTEARKVADKDHPQTITVIGDITLETALDITDAKDEFVTIKGDNIIVPENVTLQVKKATIESDIHVLGKSCCTAGTGGRLSLQGGATIGNVTMKPTEARWKTTAEYNAYNPQIVFGTNPNTVAAGKTIDVQAGKIVVDRPVEFKGNIKIAEGANLTVQGNNGDLNFMGGTVENNGTIEVKKGGKFDMTDANGNSTATDGQRMTNNGTFIHNVDAGVGTAVQLMNQNGEYRCRVDEQKKLTDAYLQWTACSVIEMVNTSAYSYDLGTAAGIKVAGTATPYKHNNKYIDIEVNSGGVTTFDNPKIGSTSNGDSKIIEIGNLTVTAGGLTIDYVTGTGKRSLKVHGDMTVKATTTITDSKKIEITDGNVAGTGGNLTIEGDGIVLTYKGSKANEEGLDVKKDITVKGENANFDAYEDEALNIKCANFYLTDKAKAQFGNRTDGAQKTMTVSGTISNPKDCTFDIKAATGSNLLAWITCTTLEVGGNFTGARPSVVAK